MYSRLPYFVFGFHGCDEKTKQSVLHGDTLLTPSENDYDWLGAGIYFWEQNYQRAQEFAQTAHENPNIKYTNAPIHSPAVLGAVIDLGNCLNLIDTAHIRLLQTAYEVFDTAAKMLEINLPENQGSYPDKPLRRLDRSVIETLHLIQPRDGSAFDTVRGMFHEGKELYPGAGFREKNTYPDMCKKYQLYKSIL